MTGRRLSPLFPFSLGIAPTSGCLGVHVVPHLPAIDQRLQQRAGVIPQAGAHREHGPHLLYQRLGRSPGPVDRLRELLKMPANGDEIPNLLPQQLNVFVSGRSDLAKV